MKNVYICNVGFYTQAYRCTPISADRHFLCLCVTDMRYCFLFVAHNRYLFLSYAESLKQSLEDTLSYHFRHCVLKESVYLLQDKGDACNKAITSLRSLRTG